MTRFKYVTLVRKGNRMTYRTGDKSPVLGADDEKVITPPRWVRTDSSNYHNSTYSTASDTWWNLYAVDWLNYEMESWRRDLLTEYSDGLTRRDEPPNHELRPIRPDEQPDNFIRYKTVPEKRSAWNLLKGITGLMHDNTLYATLSDEQHEKMKRAEALVGEVIGDL